MALEAADDLLFRGVGESFLVVVLSLRQERVGEVENASSIFWWLMILLLLSISSHAFDTLVSNFDFAQVLNCYSPSLVCNAQAVISGVHALLKLRFAGFILSVL
ncbi:hypothetical protein U1Q18_005713 [Sarracenia purpurea var. burkii]